MQLGVQPEPLGQLGGPARRVLPLAAEPERQRPVAVRLELPQDVARAEPAARRPGSSPPTAARRPPATPRLASTLANAAVSPSRPPRSSQRPAQLGGDVAAGDGVALAGAAHALADELLEVLAIGHVRCPPHEAGARSPRHHTPAASGDEHDCQRSRGHRSPLPPRRRPAWTATQGSGARLAVGADPTNSCARLARECSPVCSLKGPIWTPRAPRCPSTWSSARAASAPPRATFYDTFDGRVHGEGLTRPPRRRPARADRPRDRRGARHRRAPPRPSRASSTHDLPDGFAPRRRDRDARAGRRSPASARARSRSASSTPTRRPSCGSPSRPTRSATRPCTAASSPPPCAATTATSSASSALLARDAELARGDGPARRRGRRGRRPRRPRARARSSTASSTPTSPPASAAATVFARLLEIIDDNLPGTLEDVDSEFLHDLRVAVRRTRSLQRQFKAVYPERLQHYRDEFKRLQADHRRPARPRRLPARLPRAAAPRSRRRCRPTWTRCAACSRPAARAR